MHYYIDGYNLLFKSVWSSQSANLEKARSALIQELDAEVSLLPIEVTIVFDAPLQNEELKRGHFRSLEIIFTSRGQTADDYLISAFQGLKSPKNVVLVTSDRDLQKRAKLFSVKSESIAEFLSWLRKKSYKKKISEKPAVNVKLSPKQASKEQLQPSPKKEQASLPKMKTAKKQTQDVLPPLSDFLLWEKLFEERLSELDHEEHAKKRKKK